MNNSIDYKIKCKYGELAQSLLRNVNEHFVSVSFTFTSNDKIITRFILSKQTEIEDELIDDAIAEFAALQSNDIILQPEILVDPTALPLEHVVFAKAK